MESRFLPQRPCLFVRMGIAMSQREGHFDEVSDLRKVPRLGFADSRIRREGGSMSECAKNVRNCDRCVPRLELAVVG